MKAKTRQRWIKPAAIALLAGLPAAGSFAANVSAQSEGYGVQVQAEILNLLSVDLLNGTPGQYAGGSAPAPYNVSSGLVTLDTTVGTGIGPVLGTSVDLGLLGADGVLSASAASDVDGAPGSRTTTGFGQVNGLDLDLVDAGVTVAGIPTLNLDLLNVGATTISSTSTVTGDFGSLTAVGVSIIQDLVLNVNGVDLDLVSLLGANGNIDANGFLIADPNTVLLNVGGVVGLNITLNEQIVTGDGITSAMIETNAIHISASGIDLGLPLVDETLNADIIIGHSEASMLSIVPEPGSFALLSLGGLAMLRRRRA
ncbi:MAG: PEP-CTERM sorting domain-containing protein [Phycisphaerales bacterium JB063]